MLLRKQHCPNALWCGLHYMIDLRTGIIIMNLEDTAWIIHHTSVQTPRPACVTCEVNSLDTSNILHMIIVHI